MKQRDLLKVTMRSEPTDVCIELIKCVAMALDVAGPREATAARPEGHGPSGGSPLWSVLIFVRDLATKMQKQAAEGVGLTPVELKKAVLASGELNFLHEKVSAIDESDAKYHKPARGGKKRAQSTATKKPSTKKARTTEATKSSKPTATTTELPITKAANERRIQSGVSLVKDSIASAPLIPATRALEVEEDDNYDESDSDA